MAGSWFHDELPAWAHNIRSTDPFAGQRLVDEYVANTRRDLPHDEQVALGTRAWRILAPMPVPAGGPGWWATVSAQIEDAVTKAGG